MPANSNQRLPGGGLYPGIAPIDAVGLGGFRFAGMSHRGGLLVLPDRMQAWPPSDVAELVMDDFAAILAVRDGIDFLLLGTGADHTVPPLSVSNALAAAGIVLDPMSTRAACRTVNVLLAERRSFAAALLPAA